MKRSRSLMRGAVASLALHGLALGVFLSVRAPVFEATAVIPPISVDLIDPAGSAASVSSMKATKAPMNPAGRAARAHAGISTVRPGLHETSISAAAPTANGSGASGDDVATAGSDDGVESRWRVAARGRNPVANRPLKPDCSISNPDYIWPHHEAFCRRERATD
ncbi:hypothetical protein BH10PSE1_BH10PSE1_09310 [soil metagenome]